MRSVSRAVPLAVAALMTGCGDYVASDAALAPDSYRARLAVIGRAEDAAHRGVERAMRSTSVTEIRTLLDRFGDAQDEVGDRVAALNPPRDAAAANARLAAGAHELADQVHATAAALDDTRSPKTALRIIDARLGRASGARLIDSALAELRRLGYARRER